MGKHLRNNHRWIIHLAEYFLALGAIAATTVILYLLREQINPTTITLLYLVPVCLVSAVWRLGPGVLAAVGSFLSLNYYFIPPYNTLFVHQTQDLLGLFVFLGVSIGIGQLVGRVRKNLAEATAREHEAIQLYELSARLVGLQKARDIALALAEIILTTLQAEMVQVMIDAQGESPAMLISLPMGSGDQVNQPKDKPVLIAPLQSGRGLLGEIRIWRAQAPLNIPEERLTQTFASQSVLALERARLTQADNRARVLEESDRLKSSLLSSVSHELRTPLATIKAAVTSLRSESIDWEPEAQADLLAAIEEETDHLNQLVGNLLNMARIEGGALKPQRAWNALTEIVASALTRTRQQTQRHTIQVDVPEELPAIPVDYFQIEQVFTNLISNSAKYSPANSVIRIQAHPSEASLVIMVSNQGPPVPPEHLDRIFDKFYRITAAERITGAGLGLSICKGIVESHGGKIWAKNLPGGFAFYFTLPLTWEGFSTSPSQEIPEA
jgi:two-component system sensor histidine kinase KdpD